MEIHKLCTSMYGSMTVFLQFAAILSTQVSKTRSHRNLVLMQLLDKTDQHHSDLLSGVYEGGLKIWECAFDMLDYMTEMSIDFTGKRVLDLGCGAGLLGIHALLNGAAEVHFQDYNPEVIDCLTTANTVASCARNEPISESQHCNGDQLPFLSDRALALINKCSFFSGDWSEFSHLLHSLSSRPPLYDIILTSETIYSTDSQPKLFDVLKQFTYPSGIVFLAAKSHYFGVGGTLPMFEELVRSDDSFEYTVVKEFSDGVTRKIVKLQLKHAVHLSKDDVSRPR